jgi:hypothetical protein
LQRLLCHHSLAKLRKGTYRIAIEIFVHTLGVIEDYEYVGVDTAGNERRRERIAARAAVAGDISGQKSEWKKRKKYNYHKGSLHGALLLKL